MIFDTIVKIKEQGEKCDCGGEIDRLYKIGENEWRGRCFVCGADCTVIMKDAEEG